MPQHLTKTGICLAHITDHLPVFSTVAKRLPLCRDLFLIWIYFLIDFEATDFNSLVNEGVNQRMNNVINALQSLSNKHAPLRKLSNKKKKSHFLSNDPDKVTYYKSYNNNLNRIKD